MLYSTWNQRVMMFWPPLKNPRRACRQATSGGSRDKAMAALRSCNGSGRSSASKMVRKVPVAWVRP